MSFAGLWAHWQSDDGSEIQTCSFITTSANKFMAPIQWCRSALIVHVSRTNTINLGRVICANLAIPTNEHYLPLLYVLALQRPDDPVSFFAEGLPLRSISMRSVRIG
ncbi:MAG: SOS response-associated peptidase family protein [Deltaproteobacteria bacterium]